MYPSAATLVAASEVAELAAKSATEQEELRQQAIASVEGYTGQRFEPEDKTVVLDGNGRDAIYLPQRLEALDVLVVRGTSLNVSDAVVSENGDRLIIPPVGGGYYTRALMDQDEPRSFRRGTGAVAITGTWGWTTCPPLVVTALRKDMENQAKLDASTMSGPVAAYRAQGIKAITQRGLSITLGDAPRGSQTGLAPDLQRSLERYVWIGRLGESV